MTRTLQFGSSVSLFATTFPAVPPTQRQTIASKIKITRFLPPITTKSYDLSKDDMLETSFALMDRTAVEAKMRAANKHCNGAIRVRVTVSGNPVRYPENGVDDIPLLFVCST